MRHPAQAGIQRLSNQRHWTPAFAGVTSKRIAARIVTTELSPRWREIRAQALAPTQLRMNRREFLHVLAAASAAGSPLAVTAPRRGSRRRLRRSALRQCACPAFHRLPCAIAADRTFASRASTSAGRCREAAAASGRRTPCSATSASPPGTRDAYAFTYARFRLTRRAPTDKLGGFAHLATLIERLKASRPGALLLDGGDTWQGSATSLWTQGQDMIDASKLLGVDAMTAHWEFTYGAERVQAGRRATISRAASHFSRRT